MDDLPPHSTCYNYAYEQEDQQTNDDVLELGTENEREGEREFARKDSCTSVKLETVVQSLVKLHCKTPLLACPPL